MLLFRSHRVETITVHEQPPAADTAADPTGLADLGDAVQIDLEDPEQGFYWGRIRDWITVLPELDHTAFRVYCVFVELATKQSRFRRRLTKDAVRWLMTGVKGKPMAKTTFNDALVVLDTLGLVVIKAGSGKAEQVRDANTGQFRSDESVLFQVRDMPRDLDTFDGWRNVFDKLNAYPGPGWDKKPASATSSRDRNSGDGDHQATVDNHPTPQHPDRNSGDGTDQEIVDSPAAAGHRDRNFGDGNRNSEQADRNSGATTDVTSTNAGDLDSPSRQSFQTDKDLSVRPSPAVPPHADGRTDHPQPEPTAAAHERAGALLAEWPIKQLLQQRGARTTQLQRLRQAVAHLLDHHAEDQVRGYVLMTVRTAQTTKFVLDGLEQPQHLANLYDATPASTPNSPPPYSASTTQQTAPPQPQRRRPSEDHLRSLANTGAIVPSRIQA